MISAPSKMDRRHAIGRKLREWRFKRDLSQVEVARVSGITQASLSNYETGKRDLPLSTFLSVAAALDLSIGDLLDVPEIVVVRDSRIGRAVARLVEHPELAESLTSPVLGEAAS